MGGRYRKIIFWRSWFQEKDFTGSMRTSQPLFLKKLWNEPRPDERWRSKVLNQCWAFTVQLTPNNQLSLRNCKNSKIIKIDKKAYISFLNNSNIHSWTKPIRNILNQDPEADRKLCLYPTPNKEIEIWEEKTKMFLIKLRDIVFNV